MQMEHKKEFQKSLKMGWNWMAIRYKITEVQEEPSRHIV